jgi:ribosomal protein S8E
MAEFGQLLTISAQAGEDLRAKQYHIVRLSAADQVAQATNAASSTGIFGVIQNKPASLEAATVAVFGETKIVAGGAITAGVMITTNASGRATAATSGQMVLGRAMVAAASDGEVIRALIHPPVRWGIL